jgi:hypothetical protein
MEPRGCRINPATGEIEVQFGHDNANVGNSFDRLIGAR